MAHVCHILMLVQAIAHTFFLWLLLIALIAQEQNIRRIVFDDGECVTQITVVMGCCKIKERFLECYFLKDKLILLL